MLLQQQKSLQTKKSQLHIHSYYFQPLSSMLLQFRLFLAKAQIDVVKKWNDLYCMVTLKKENWNSLNSQPDAPFFCIMTSFEINLSLDELLSIKSRQAIKFVIKIPFSIAVTTNFPVLFGRPELQTSFKSLTQLGYPNCLALTCTFHHFCKDCWLGCIPHFPHGTGIDLPQTNRFWSVRIQDGNSYRRNL